jgi:cardiolipin synthase A/B
VKLIIQPEDGLQPILRALRSAKTSIDIIIFRCDLKAVEKELASAVTRDVAVRVLVAHTNAGGARELRALESRLLKAGVTVARTDDDLVRYHGKVLLIDRKTLYVLGFNFTSADVKSRSFGVVTKNPKMMRDVLGLIEADVARKDFRPTAPDLVVSPENARTRLTQFLRNAKKSIDIYDGAVTDDDMIQLLKARVAKGVTVRILGKLEKKWRGQDLDVRPCPGRLHVRAIVRDGQRAFVGSQSLRKLELDERREVGVIVRDAATVKRIQSVFEKDWRRTRRG